MPNGTVKFFNASKGFGFVIPDEGGKELFVPAASVASAGISDLKVGQRVSFDAKPDPKGPTVINLTLLARVDAPTVVKREACSNGVMERKPGLTFYHDPASPDSQSALNELRTSGHHPRIVNYLATPPEREELKRISRLLHGSDQNLVRKYDPLFFALCLDDRFMSENEFWGAIVEHPSLINGPILVTESKASICKSQNAVKAFLASGSSVTTHASKPKGLPERLQGLVSPHGRTSTAIQETDAEKAHGKSRAKARRVEKVVAEGKNSPRSKGKPKARVKAKIKSEPKRRPKTKAKPILKLKPKTKAKTGKQAIRKPVKNLGEQSDR